MVQRYSRSASKHRSDEIQQECPVPRLILHTSTHMRYRTHTHSRVCTYGGDSNVTHGDPHTHSNAHVRTDTITTAVDAIKKRTTWKSGTPGMFSVPRTSMLRCMCVCACMCECTQHQCCGSDANMRVLVCASTPFLAVPPSTPPDPATTATRAIRLALPFHTHALTHPSSHVRTHSITHLHPTHTLAHAHTRAHAQSHTHTHSHIRGTQKKTTQQTNTRIGCLGLCVCVGVFVCGWRSYDLCERVGVCQTRARRHKHTQTGTQAQRYSGFEGEEHVWTHKNIWTHKIICTLTHKGTPTHKRTARMQTHTTHACPPT